MLCRQKFCDEMKKEELFILVWWFMIVKNPVLRINHFENLALSAFDLTNEFHYLFD